MADNVQFQTSVTATPPNATVVSTEEVTTLNGGAVSAQHVQRAALALRTADATAIDLPGDASNGLDVDVTRVQGTVQALGTVQTHGTSQALGTVQTHGTSQALGTVQPLAGSVHVANVLSGTVQTHGTSQVLGTVQPLAGSVHVANVPLTQGYAAHDAAVTGNPLLIGAFGSSGTQAAVSDGDAVRLWADPNGRLQVRGTIDSLPSIAGTVQTHGTSQALGTVQPLAGSVHVANILSGTFQSHGTNQALGTVQPLAGSVHLATNLPGGTVVAVGSAVHGAAADARPLLMSAFGSSGTQVAVDDGDAVRLWADLNGRLQIRGTIDSMPAISVTTGTIPGGTVQIHGTAQVLGTVQTHGTSQVLGTVRALTEVTVTVGTIAEGTINSFTGTAQVLGTIQPLAGSVHVANTAAVIGSVSAQGYVANGGVAAGNPVLLGGFGSSGTQAAVDDGDVVRAWFDLNGRLQVRGTIDSLPSITVGAALPAGDNNIGNVDVVTMPTVTVVGTVQTHGTSQALGTVQPLAGSVHVANVPLTQGSVAHDSPAGGNPLLVGGYAVRARPGTVAVDDAVRYWTDQHGRQVVQVGAGTTEAHGTTFTGAGANGTILAARGAGSYWRVFDMTLSGSGGGTFAIMMDTTVVWGPLFIANNGGWSFNSAVGVRLPTANSSLNGRFTAGTWSLFMNYGVEGA